MNLKQLLPVCALVGQVGLALVSGQAAAGPRAALGEPGPNTPAATALEAAPVLVGAGL